MSAQLFIDQPEFISNDPRNDPHHDVGWNAGFQSDRYEAWLKDVDLRDKRVLDLGCAGAAVGAYCLHRGAAHYHGVEISEPIAAMAESNLRRYYDEDRWCITVDAAESFICILDMHWDVIIAAGVMHGVTDMLNFMIRMASLAPTVLFECFHPNMTVIPALLDRLMYLAPTPEERGEISRAMAWIEREQPYIEINPHGMMCLDDRHASANNILKFGPSMGALKVIMDRLGFTADYAPYDRMVHQHPRYFSRGRRYAMLFRRTHAAKPMSFADLQRSGMLESQAWDTLGSDRIGA